MPDIPAFSGGALVDERGNVPSLVLEGVLVLVQDPGTSVPAGDRLPPGEDSR